MPQIKAIIADDEEQLRIHLAAQLARLWPDLTVCGEAENGLRALELVAANKPDIAFLDIRMPGLSGLEVARRIAPACRVVFITAYDQYALAAFESEAIDYILKPVSTARLQQTVARLKRQIRATPAPDLSAALERLLAAMDPARAAVPGYLQWIKARRGESVRLVAVEDICYFKAEDKYTAVKTRQGEYLIKKSIRQLATELDPGRFWRIHRGTIVNADRIVSAHRDLAGRFTLRLKDLPETLTVSRTYTHLFRQM